MVSTSEGVVYYCTVFLTAIVFLTEASAITTNYEKSTAQNKTTDSSPEVSPQRTKLAPTRSRSGLSKNQNHERVSPLTLSKLKTSARLETQPQGKSDRELMLVSNSGGENDVKDKGGGNADDDDQKTLSQQVADGKYGLIQHEIFTQKPARPGVLSYDVNPEVPKDNINNLGGLEPDDIWLAENHLLVLAGSGLASMQNQWTPIDNYVAPKRQVQIPPNPKVPPPFPVQLSDDGPIEYIKPNSRPGLPVVPFYNPLLTQYQSANNTQEHPTYGRLPIGPLTGAANLPLKPSLPLSPHRQQPPPIYVKPPPGAEFIPPYLGNVNTSEAIDEDDPSLYYPPPYDFYYARDNTTKVPPGPLVPGIVLPPPPDFFTLWVNNTVLKDISKLTIVKDKSRKQNTIFKSGKQLHHPTDAASKPEIRKPEQPKSKYVAFNELINEVTYPDMHDDKITYADVKVNKVSTEELNEDWIPIPAPKPFYITGEKKPTKNTVLVVMEPPEDFGYTYDKPITPLKIAAPKRPLLKYLQYIDKPDERYLPTTPISPQLASTKSSFRDNTYTTTPLSSYQPPNTIKATYYFYEEPKFIDTTNTKSLASTTPQPALPSSAEIDYNDYSLTKPLSNYQPSKSAVHDAKHAVHGSQENKRKPITPMIPIYYLAELDNLVDLVKPMNLPYATTQSAPKSEYYTTTAKPTYTINKPSYERPTPKPILEYSYVASGYNNPNRQQHQQHSTPSPTNYDNRPRYSVNYNPRYQPPRYEPLYNALPQYDKPVQTTANPILLLNPYAHPNAAAPPPYDTFDRPWLPNLNVYNQATYTTANPYYAFFTKEDEDLIDENTKKYFTIFGQKIKQSVVEATSPLSTRAPAPTTGYWHAAAGAYPSQSSTGDYYGSSTTPYTGADYASPIDARHRLPPPASSSPSPPPALAAYPETGVDEKPLSLQGDTLVNYVTPLPERNTDAEYVTPTIGKRIRPIVVEDLPPDVHQRLKNLMESQRRDKNARYRGGGNTAATATGGSKTRYVLVDHEYGGSNGGGVARHPSPADGEPPQARRRPAYRHRVASSGTSTPVSLVDDVRVNYRSALKTNPDAEYVSTSSEYRGNSVPDSSTEGSLRGDDVDDDDDDESGGKKSRGNSKPISLENDILVNYKEAARYRTEPDAEYIGAAGEQNAMSSQGGGGGSSSNNVVAFKYPDVDHGHFYFLTPQEARLTQIEDERYDHRSNVEKPSSYFKRRPTTSKSEKSR